MTDRPLASDDWVLDLIDALRDGFERARARNDSNTNEGHYHHDDSFDSK